MTPLGREGFGVHNAHCTVDVRYTFYVLSFIISIHQVMMYVHGSNTLFKIT